MSTFVRTGTCTHTTAYVATNIAFSLRQLIVGCGLDPSKLNGMWTTLGEGLRTWLTTGHLKRVTLEVVDCSTNRLIRRFDFDIWYTHDPLGNEELWLDAKVVDYAIRKATEVSSECDYSVVVTAPGRPDVPGWTSTWLRDSSHLSQRSVGSAVGGGGTGAMASYWR